MELFKLPKHLAEKISISKTPGPVYRIIPLYDSPEMTDFLLAAIIGGVMEEVKEYYHSDNLCNKKIRVATKVNRQSISDVVYEGIRNAVAHGCIGKGKEGLITYGLFYGETGICHGFRDEGKYFSMQSTKKMFENKIPIKKFNEEVEGLSGFGGGVDMIYSASDKIFVDIEQNTLFCIQYRDRIVLLPK